MSRASLIKAAKSIGVKEFFEAPLPAKQIKLKRAPFSQEELDEIMREFEKALGNGDSKKLEKSKKRMQEFHRNKPKIRVEWE